MNIMLRKRNVVWVCILAFILLSGPFGQAQTENSLSFQWAFAALTGDDTDRKLTQITKDTVLKSGDQLKMMIELNETGYVYVLYNASNGEITTLFPTSNDSASIAMQVGKRYFLPEGNLWFTLDEQAGFEKFYLLASKTPLVELEDLLEDYEQAPDSDKPALADEIRGLVKQMRKQNRKLVAAAAERPIEIGGNFRAVSKGPLVTQDISLFAIDISGSEFFARTFTIEHK